MNEGDEAWWARKLADNEPTVRRKAIRRLRRWLNLRSESDRDFTEEEMLKIWKGLFYCVWMSDKPLVQEELVSDIASMLFEFNKEETKFLFLEIFFVTMAREWVGIDQLRLDKFLMLVRRMISVCFELLKTADWEEALVQKFVAMMMKHPANADETNLHVPLGLQSHVADVYVEELIRVGEKRLAAKTGNLLLEPFCCLMASSPSAVLLERINRRVFEYAIRVTDGESPTLAEETEVDTADVASPSLGVMSQGKKKPLSYKRMVQGKVKEAMTVPLFSFDYIALANHLFELASSKNVTRRNRSMMYRLIKRLKLLAQGHFPLDQYFPKPGKGLVPKHYRQATKRLLELDEEDAQESRFRKLEVHTKRQKKSRVFGRKLK